MDQISETAKSNISPVASPPLVGGVDRPLKVSEVAQVLDVTPQTLYNWHASGRHKSLKWIKLGRKLLMPRQNLEAFLAECSQEKDS